MTKRISIAAAVVVALAAVFFYKTLFFSLLPAPTDTLVGLYHPWRDTYASRYPRGVPFKNFLITDPVRQQIPWRKTVIDYWKSGRIPSWDPFIFAGAPLNANIQAAPFYAGNIVFALLPFQAGWAVLVILQPVLAAFFCMLYLLHLKRSFAASVLGGLVWAFGGFSIAWLTWGTIMQTALWLPLMLLSIDKLREKTGKPRWAAVLAVSAVMALTAGHIQIALYVYTVAALYFAWRWRGTKGFPVRYVLGAAAAAILMSAIQWIPLISHIPDTLRAADTGNWHVPGWFLPWQHLIQFVVPDYFGNPATLNYTGVWNYGELVGYIGIIPLVLALSATGVSGVPLFFSFLLIGAFLFMLPGPVSYAPFALKMPLVSALQPTRLMMIVDFALAVLAAYGLDGFSKKRLAVAVGIVGAVLSGAWITAFAGKNSVATHNLIIPTLFFAALCVFYLLRIFIRGKGLVRILYAAVCLVTVMDLFRFGWKFTPFTPASYWFPDTGALSYIKKSAPPFRVMSLDDRILPPDSSEYFGIETIEGYDPAVSARFDRFLSVFESGKADAAGKSGFNRIYTAHNVDSPLLPYTNVRYILSLSDIRRPYLRLVHQEGEVRVYENSRLFARAYLADNVVVARDGQDTLAKLVALSPAPVGIVEKPLRVLNLPLSSDEGVNITRYVPDHMSFTVTVDNPRLLVVLTSYDPGWHAVIDGKESPPVRANYLYMGIIVPPGTHNIVLTYR